MLNKKHLVFSLSMLTIMAACSKNAGPSGQAQPTPVGSQPAAPQAPVAEAPVSDAAQQEPAVESAAQEAAQEAVQQTIEAAPTDDAEMVAFLTQQINSLELQQAMVDVTSQELSVLRDQLRTMDGLYDTAATQNIVALTTSIGGLASSLGGYVALNATELEAGKNAAALTKNAQDQLKTGMRAVTEKTFKEFDANPAAFEVRKYDKQGRVISTMRADQALNAASWQLNRLPEEKRATAMINYRNRIRNAAVASRTSLLREMAAPAFALKHVKAAPGYRIKRMRAVGALGVGVALGAGGVAFLASNGSSEGEFLAIKRDLEAAITKAENGIASHEEVLLARSAALISILYEAVKNKNFTEAELTLINELYDRARAGMREDDVFMIEAFGPPVVSIEVVRVAPVDETK